MATLKSREILQSRQANPTAIPVNRYSSLKARKEQIRENTPIQVIQNPLGIAGGIVSEAINSVLSGEILSGTKAEGLSLTFGTLGYSHMWRLKLLMKNSNMEKSEYSPRPSLKGGETLANKNDELNLHTTTTLSYAEKTSPDYAKISARRSQRGDFIPMGKNYIMNKFNALAGIPKGHLNEIIIINPNVSPYVSLTLQNRPNELKIEPKGTWAAVSSMGRNNPFMMYTGGEDMISFEISWYANDKNHREEVITKCKLLESWTKADGYLAAPPVLQIMWGNSGLFDNDYFILESAPYTLSHFQDRAWAQLDSPTLDNPSTIRSTVRNLNLYPNCATQTLTFKKVSRTNLTHQDILPTTRIEGIIGISPKTITV